MLFVAVCDGEKLIAVINDAGRRAVRSNRIALSSLWLVVFSLLLFVVGGLSIFVAIQQDSLVTFFLFSVVTLGGVVLCQKTQSGLNDPRLRVLGYFWLIKLGLTLFLLYVGWMPQLDPSSVAWGYDPQRYYIQAKELIDNNWSIDLHSLNYVGILYYYGAIYRLLGFNPVIPALINAFVTLLASLFLIKVCYEIKGKRESRDWILAFVLLLPEVLWFDVMTSRETLVAALLLLALLTAGRYFAKTASISLFRLLIIVGFSTFAIAAVRTSMLFPLLASIMLMALLIKSPGKSLSWQRPILLVSLLFLLFIGTLLTGSIGGDEFDIGNMASVITTKGENVASQVDGWSQNSIGALLMADGIFQAILFLPPRMVLYWLAPLPDVWVPISELLSGNWGVWQKLFTLLSSVFNVLALPYVFASLVHSVRSRKENAAPLVLHISFWVTIIAIAGGNMIIHERYRVMSTLLLFGCAWLGTTTCSKRLVVKASMLWYGLLALGALFYLVYKFTA